LAMNIKLDAMMKKLGITAQDILAAEEESDADLEQQKKKIEHARSTRKPNSKR
jgi:hypothetical protein